MSRRGEYDCGALKIGFGAAGGITTLNDWADEDHPVAQPRYQAMSGDFFHTFTKQYNYHTAGNFDKTDLSVPSMDANVTLLTLLRRTADDDSATSFVYNASLPDAPRPRETSRDIGSTPPLWRGSTSTSACAMRRNRYGRRDGSPGLDK